MHNFTARNSTPNSVNQYYISSKTPNINNKYGYNPCKVLTLNSTLNVLPNCVGYAIGRWDEILSLSHHVEILPNDNAVNFWTSAQSLGYVCDQTPEVGAYMVWSGNTYGHVAVVEKVLSSTEIVVSESSYGTTYGPYVFDFASDGRVYNSNASIKWKKKDPSGPGLSMSSSYTFLGFIHNPYMRNGVVYDTIVTSSSATIPTESDTANTPTTGGANSETVSVTTYSKTQTNVNKHTTINSSYNSSKVTYKTITTTTEQEKLFTSNEVTNFEGTSLLSYPSYVETPFIIVKIGNYTFGTYTKETAQYTEQSMSIVDYPNYVTGINITKVNGTVNTYSIQLVYQIQAGNDPNLIDRILSSVGYGLIKISYGDWSSPSFIYREEEAIITNVTTNADFGSSRITYTINCTSNSLALISNTVDYSARKAKPSDIIKEKLYDTSTGLLDIFYGMKNKLLVDSNSLIASDDQTVQLYAQTGSNILSYLNYLVSCMSSNTSTNKNLNDSVYKLVIHDDVSNIFGGPYFEIKKVALQNNTITTSDTYVLDVGYPGENQIVSFTLNDNNSWALLYNYNEKISQNNYVYYIDNNGHMTTSYAQNLLKSTGVNEVTESNRSWWTNMTQFPINATIELKGLVRPAVLMTYVKVNAIFYGQRHVSSGLYIITKQEDTVNSQGYRTTLTLTRVAGDTDYIQTVQTTSSITAAISR